MHCFKQKNIMTDYLLESYLSFEHTNNCKELNGLPRSSLYPRTEKKYSWSLEASLPLTHPCTEEHTHRVEAIYRSSDVFWMTSLKHSCQYLKGRFQQAEDFL